MVNKHNKILLAEDEPTISKAYGDYLGGMGYEIEFAYDGEEAALKIKELKPDLVLLDIVMPKKDGIAVLRDMKDNEETKDIPVIVLTNLETNQSVNEAIEAGSSEYLVKTNYSLEDINNKISEVLTKTYK